MKAVIYIILLALAAILIKAFYFDSLKSGPTQDTNFSEGTVVEQDAGTDEQSSLEENQTESKKKVNKGWGDREKMPLDKLGDSIADKIEDKIQ